MANTALALGSNLGDPEENLKLALELLSAGGFELAAVAPNVRTAPVECAPGTPDFLNTAAIGTWPGTPEELLALCQKVELRLGRPADHGVNTPRTIDVDIVDISGVALATPRLTLPHPRAARRRFVLEPLAAIAPNWEIGGETVTELLALLPA